jgi:peptidoglycan/LPS O-acetylase OafA/YrhL
MLKYSDSTNTLPVKRRPESEEILPKIAQFFSLDVFRGLAAIWVVMLHACVPYISGVGAPYLPYLNNPIYAFSVRGQLGVTVFFVISGYCILGAVYNSIRSEKTAGKFLLERIRRIYPPYLATIVIALVYQAAIEIAARRNLIHVGHLKPLGSFSWLFWLANLTVTQQEFRQESFVIVFWSLSYEVAFYFIVALFLLMARYWAQSKVGQWKYLSILINVTTAVSLLSKLVVKDDFALFPLDRWWQFGMGALIFQIAVASRYEGKDRRLQINTPFAFCALAAGALAILAATSHDTGGLVHPATGSQAAMCLGFTCLLLLLQRRETFLVSLPIFKPLAALGGWSYSLYLIHTLAQPVFDVELRKAGLVQGLYIVNYAVQIAVSLLAGWAFFLLVEKRFIGKAARVRLQAENVIAVERDLPLIREGSIA